jgi:ribosome-binding protein aMBF1 (putative translation factor)
MYTHQDWTTVVLKKKTRNERETERQPKSQIHTPTISSIANKPAYKIEMQVDSDQGKPVTYVSMDDAKKITSGRIQQNMTREQLARAVNKLPRHIHDIETGKAILNKNDLAAIKKFLKIT